VSADNPARPRWWKRWFGGRSEKSAETFLKELGYRILARNYSCKLGELDLVALDGAFVVFVEVRSTGGEDSLRAAQSVNLAKQRRLTRLALHFLKRHKLLDRPARFDVLAVRWPDGQDRPEITHYPNAFEACGD
jgi:putative endonuclease